jgi:hypothetical protein
MKQTHSQALPRRAKRFRGKFPSFRLNRLLSYESLLERDYLYLLEFDHQDALDFQVRPCTIHYTADNRRARFVPAFGVVRRHKKQLVEVTSVQRATSEVSRLRYRIAAQLCEREGYEFVVATEAMIREQPRLDNVKLLIRYQRAPTSAQHQIMCHDLFNAQPEASLGEVFDFFVGRNVDKQTVYALLRWGVLDIDLSRPIASNSLVRLPAARLAERKVS